MNITIIKPGIQSSLQDFGKWGEQAFGVSIGGVMDPLAAKIANILCKNNEEAPVMEMTLHGTEILFNQDASIAITGSGSIPYINDVEIPFNKLIQVPKFSILKTKPSPVGCRSYLAVADTNGAGFQKIEISNWQINYAENISQEKIIHCIPGPEWNWFDETSQKNFFSHQFTVSNQSNRMGYRLEGMKLKTKDKKELLSTAVTKGIVQVTHEGFPIVLMSDAQTTGGYPRIGRIASTDFSILAQCRPSDKISFKEISEEDAISSWKNQESMMKKIKNSIALT
jgi:antagonist of KipI